MKSLENRILDVITKSTKIQVHTNRLYFELLTGVTSETCHGAYGRVSDPFTGKVVKELLHFFPDKGKGLPTLLHELAHATGHPDRLDRVQDDFSQGMTEAYAFEEIIAETTAMRVMMFFNVLEPDIQDEMNRYISKFTAKVPAFRLNELETEVNKATHYMISHWIREAFEEEESVAA